VKIENQRVDIHGHLLHRLVLHPDNRVGECAAAIFYHGQGDYAERYAEVLEPFTDRGIRCVVTDLPGHGYSPGRRGHGGDAQLLDAMIQNTLESFGALPQMVMGHSMGGLLALRHLVLAGLGKFPEPQWAWINAPLIRPAHGKSELLVRSAHTLGRWFPELTISTGVTSKMCRSSEDSSDAEKERRALRHKLWHSRISLGWGSSLLSMGSLLEEFTESMPKETSILFTQGGDDVICPPKFAREFFKRLPQKDKRYHEFSGALHELFADEGKQELMDVLESWLRSQGFES